MAAADVTTMVLRFRDLVTAPGDTIQEHYDVSQKEGFVWWGWWSKAGERIPDDVFREAREHFNEDELVNLTLAVVASNGS